MNDPKIKQQVVEKIKDSTSILVTVSKDPSVDELSAALGLTLLLNKLDKHATAVFSGAIPPAITFLDPEKTFENTVDSLRDFIIALDKEKADHLRYKVDGDVVKIFITPYRTTITSDDLEFSQGDYNVELVLALGVESQDHLDSALEAHGKILHDAAVVTVTAGESTSQLGSLDWHEAQSSSLSEMVAGLVDSLKGDKSVLDGPMATAFLTGIVAATDRFSNTRTTSRVMTLAAQLMAAGADQQLIAAKLQESHEINDLPAPNAKEPIPEGTAVKLDTSSAPASSDGGLSIAHTEGQTLEQIADAVAVDNQAAAAVQAEKVLAERESAAVPEVVTPATPETPSVDASPQGGAVNWTPGSDAEPSLGGTLNATTDQAADDARRELENDQNKTILTHSYLGTPAPAYAAPINSASQPDDAAADVDIFANNAAAPSTPIDAIAPPAPSSATPTLADLDTENRSRDHDEARAAVESALGGTPVAPVAPLSPLDLPPPPPLPDFSALPPMPLASAYALDTPPASPAQPERLGDIFAPDTNTVPSAQPAPVANDPGQFHIPGQ